MRLYKSILLFIALLLLTVDFTAAKNRQIQLNFQSAVEIALSNSYQVRQLRFRIERTRAYLRVEQAGLKSKVYMDIKAPEINEISEYEWNSTLQQDELVRQNTRLWQTNLSIRQPVIVFGYPTNGYLSLNNNIYRYLQRGITNDLSYYNRYFIQYEQPLFQPNRLRNDILAAELELERTELNYLSGLVGMINGIAGDYYSLFKLSYQQQIYKHQVQNLEETLAIAQTRSGQTTSHSIEISQAQIELANARERLNENRSSQRMESARFKQRLRLDESDSLTIPSRTNFSPIQVDEKAAIDYGYTIRPRLRILEISKRRADIHLDNVKATNSFNVDLKMTYGLEKQDSDYQDLWHQHEPSYSLSVNAHIPIWDWGQRDALLEAHRVSVRESALNIEEARNEIRIDIRNSIKNMQEYQTRALNMRKNMDMAQEITAMSMEQYRNGEIEMQSLLQNIVRQRDTELNFLEAYLGYRRSLLALTLSTYYNFENQVSLIDQFELKEQG